jgi:hypothetical protein
MSKRIVGAMAAVLLAGLLVALLAGPAAAHEERQVGKYHFAVGFGDEPAYAGEKNTRRRSPILIARGEPRVPHRSLLV